MSEFLHTLLIPFQYDYMLRAIWVSALIGGTCGFLSSFVTLKGWSLMGDALSHAVVPGVTLAHGVHQGRVRVITILGAEAPARRRLQAPGRVVAVALRQLRHPAQRGRHGRAPQIAVKRVHHRPAPERPARVTLAQGQAGVGVAEGRVVRPFSLMLGLGHS